MCTMLELMCKRLWNIYSCCALSPQITEMQLICRCQMISTHTYLGFLQIIVSRVEAQEVNRCEMSVPPPPPAPVGRPATTGNYPGNPTAHPPPRPSLATSQHKDPPSTASVPHQHWRKLLLGDTTAVARQRGRGGAGHGGSAIVISGSATILNGGCQPRAIDTTPPAPPHGLHSPLDAPRQVSTFIFRILRDTSSSSYGSTVLGLRVCGASPLQGVAGIHHGTGAPTPCDKMCRPRRTTGGREQGITRPKAGTRTVTPQNRNNILERYHTTTSYYRHTHKERNNKERN
jgi:hypothetical protein